MFRPEFLPWQAWALLSAVFAALTALFAKAGVAGVPPDFATFVRTLIIAPLLLVIVLVTRQMPDLSAVPVRTWWFLALSALATGASWVCYFRALSSGPVALVAPLDKLSVVLVAVLGVALLGERLSLKDWCGVALVASGALVIAYRPS